MQSRLRGKKKIPKPNWLSPLHIIELPCSHKHEQQGLHFDTAQLTSSLNLETSCAPVRTQAEEHWCRASSALGTLWMDCTSEVPGSHALLLPATSSKWYLGCQIQTQSHLYSYTFVNVLTVFQKSNFFYWIFKTCFCFINTRAAWTLLAVLSGLLA